MFFIRFLRLKCRYLGRSKLVKGSGLFPLPDRLGPTRVRKRAPSAEKGPRCVFLPAFFVCRCSPSLSGKEKSTAYASSKAAQTASRITLAIIWARLLVKLPSYSLASAGSWMRT